MNDEFPSLIQPRRDPLPQPTVYAPLSLYQALLSDLEDWAERLEQADDLNDPRRVAAAMREVLKAAGR